jgi:hypothetical protein
MKKLDVKKLLSPPMIGLLLVLVGIAILVVIAVTKNSDDNVAVVKAPAAPYKVINACQAFTLSDAKKIIGDTAKKSNGTSANASSKDINVSTCLYGQDTSTMPINQVRNIRTATILARSPKTAIGKQNNHDEFGKNKPAGVQDISGYGDKAFWAPSFGQLNILKGDSWVILTTGSATPSTRTLDDAKKMADIVVPKL